MKNFIQFLKESNSEKELDNSVEEFFSIKENGLEKVEDMEVVDEDDSFDFLSLADMNMMEEDDVGEELTEADKNEKRIEKGFGGEVYVSINPPSITDDKTEE